MHITDFQEMDNFFNKSPNTALGLSLNTNTVIWKDASPSSLHSRPSQAFFVAPALLASNFTSKHAEDVYARAPPPPAPLELLPLKPSSHKPSLSSSLSPSPAISSAIPSPYIWPHPSMAQSFLRGSIDMNQRPINADLDEVASESLSLSVFPGRTAENSFLMMKRERERSSDTEPERMCEVSSRGSDEDGEGGGSARKKLRLSKEQSSLLEESFKEHSTLNPKQKADLANQLNLRPRQVEVWFQNRRARTKLKQTEVDCELLRRCCESLTEENRRLLKEVTELRAIKVAPPLVISSDRLMPSPAATLSICPSCQHVASHARLGALPSLPHLISGAASAPSASKSPPQPPHHLSLSSIAPSAPPAVAQHVLPSAAC